jgi:hypothetical protein
VRGRGDAPASAVPSPTTTHHESQRSQPIIVSAAKFCRHRQVDGEPSPSAAAPAVASALDLGPCRARRCAAQRRRGGAGRGGEGFRERTPHLLALLRLRLDGERALVLLEYLLHVSALLARPGFRSDRASRVVRRCQKCGQPRGPRLPPHTARAPRIRTVCARFSSVCRRAISSCSSISLSTAICARGAVEPASARAA